MYALVALNFVFDYLLKVSQTVTDATGATWHSGDIAETAAITSLLTMMFVVALASMKVASESPRGAVARAALTHQTFAATRVSGPGPARALEVMHVAAASNAGHDVTTRRG